MRERPKAQKPRAPADRFLDTATIAVSAVAGRIREDHPLQREHSVARAMLNGPVKVFFAALIRAGTTELTLAMDGKRVRITIEDPPDAD